MCVGPGALVSALVLRIEEGYVATERDLRALLGSRCTKEEIREALLRNRSKSERFDQALALLDALN
jgi:hypothetical protein